MNFNDVWLWICVFALAVNFIVLMWSWMADLLWHLRLLERRGYPGPEPPDWPLIAVIAFDAILAIVMVAAFMSRVP